MFRFIHVADIHLDSPLRGLERYEGAPADEIRLGSRRALERMVELALEQRVDFVVIAGDVYDGTWPDHNTGLFFVKQMARLAERAIPVIVISGNHDAESKMTKNLRLPENVQRLDHRRPETARFDRLSDLRVAVHGQSFAQPKVLENLASAYPVAIPQYYNIGLLHTSLMGYEQHDPYAPCSLADLQRLGYDYWALGHIHKREQLCAEPLICFSGNIQGRSIRETGAKGCQLVTVDDSGQTTSKFIPLDIMRWEHCPVLIESAGDLDDWLQAFQEQVRILQKRHDGLPLALRVSFAGEGVATSRVSGDWTHVANQVRAVGISATGGNCWIEKVVRQEVTVSAHRRVDPIDWQGGPWSEVVQVVESGIDDPATIAVWLQSLTDLRKKLPDELLRGDEGLPLDQPEWLRKLVGELPAELARQMQSRGES